MPPAHVLSSAVVQLGSVRPRKPDCRMLHRSIVIKHGTAPDLCGLPAGGRKSGSPCCTPRVLVKVSPRRTALLAVIGACQYMLATAPKILPQGLGPHVQPDTASNCAPGHRYCGHSHSKEAASDVLGTLPCQQDALAHTTQTQFTGPVAIPSPSLHHGSTAMLLAPG